MNTGTAAKLSLFFLITLNLSFQWPMKQPSITSIFGESRGDHFHDGVDIVSSDRRVNPIAEGTLVYFWNKAFFPLENYPGGGNYAVIRHEQNIFSLYLHLEDNPSFKETVTVKDTIGISGNTGRSYGKHLHLSVLKPKEQLSMNPLAHLPEFSDEKGPEIKDAYVRIGEKYVPVKHESNIRLTRHYPLLIEIIDSVKGKERLGIYYLKADFNGTTLLEINFASIEYSKNGLTISGKAFQDLFDEKGFYKLKKIRYTEGVNRLTVVARDFRGNETTKEISFNVNLQIH